MGLSALSSIGSRIVPQGLEAKPIADNATPQDSPAQDAAIVPADGMLVTRSNSLPSHLVLPASIALQLKQLLAGGAQLGSVQSRQDNNPNAAGGQSGGDQGVAAQDTSLTLHQLAKNSPYLADITENPGVTKPRGAPAQ